MTWPADTRSVRMKPGATATAAMLASDLNVLEKSGKVLAVGDLAEEYGFTDVDGRRVPAFKIPDQD